VGTCISKTISRIDNLSPPLARRQVSFGQAGKGAGAGRGAGLAGRRGGEEMRGGRRGSRVSQRSDQRPGAKSTARVARAGGRAEGRRAAGSCRALTTSSRASTLAGRGASSPSPTGGGAVSRGDPHNPPQEGRHGGIFYHNHNLTDTHTLILLHSHSHFNTHNHTLTLKQSLIL
jgi:hypothetical protein